MSAAGSSRRTAPGQFPQSRLEKALPAESVPRVTGANPIHGKGAQCARKVGRPGCSRRARPGIADPAAIVTVKVTHTAAAEQSEEPVLAWRVVAKDGFHAGRIQPNGLSARIGTGRVAPSGREAVNQLESTPHGLPRSAGSRARRRWFPRNMRRTMPRLTGRSSRVVPACRPLPGRLPHTPPAAG